MTYDPATQGTFQIKRKQQNGLGGGERRGHGGPCKEGHRPCGGSEQEGFTEVLPLPDHLLHEVVKV